jgi:hypothetical protein
MQNLYHILHHFQNLWTKLFFLKTEETFPAILSRSKVIQRIEVDLNPIESAILSIENKNNQILDLCALHSDPSKNNSTNSLTMALNGLIAFWFFFDRFKINQKYFLFFRFY